MKLVALFVIPLLAFSAEPAGPMLISQDSVQAAFDKAVSEADQMVVSRVVIIPGTETEPLKVTLVPMWETLEVPEILALSRYVRFRLPPPREELVEGRIRREAVVFGSLLPFHVMLKQKGRRLLAFDIGRAGAGSTQLCEWSSLRIDEASFACFYAQLKERREQAEQSEANQLPEPTSGSVTPRADARVAPPPPVAHR